MKKTFSKENVRGTMLNILIIGKKINNKYYHNDINEIENFGEEINEGLEFILKEFDILYDNVLTKEEIKGKCKNNHYDIIFIEDNFITEYTDKKDISELINIIKKNNEGENSLIIGLMSDENKFFRSVLNENDIELILFKPVKIGQIVVILTNDFKWKIVE